MTRSRTRIMLTMGLALLFGGIARAEEDRAKQDPKIGEAAPAFELPDLDGENHKLSDYKGKIVVIHFQSCDCPWDRAYQPILNRMGTSYAASDDENTPAVQFLAINANHTESVDHIAKYRESAGVTYPILKDEGNKVADLYHATSTPHIYIVDAEGVLRYKGGIEKAPVRVSDVGKSEEQYLEPALGTLQAGQDLTVTVTQEKGCSIKRVKKE